MASPAAFNSCGSKSDGDTEMIDVDKFGVPMLGVGYKYEGAYTGDMSILRPGIGVSCVPGGRLEDGGVLFARYMYNGNAHKKLDRYGTLQSNGRVSWSVDAWIPVKKLERNYLGSGDWGFFYVLDVYGTEILENGDLVK